MLPYFFQIAVYASAGHHHHTGLDTEWLSGFFVYPFNTGDFPVRRHQPFNTVAEAQIQVCPVFVTTQSSLQQAHQLPTGSPDYVVPRHRITRPEFAPFHPVHRGKVTHTKRLKPLIDIRIITITIGFCPVARPVILRREIRDREPVPEHQLRAIFYSVQTLQRRSAQGHTAECLFRQPPECRRLIPIHNPHLPTRVQ